VESGGLGGKVAYLSCGEGEFPINRLVQLTERCETNFGISKRDLLNGVLIERSFNTEDLLTSLVGRSSSQSSLLVVQTSSKDVYRK
jgi:hypothetical protein